MKKFIMKKLIILLAAITLASCEDYNESVPAKEGVHVTQHEVPDYLVGDWTATGARISINKNRALINVATEHLDLDWAANKYTVIVSEDCFLEIYIEGRIIHISDWVWYDGSIRYTVDGKTYILHPVKEETPVTPIIPEPEPTPQIN